MESDEINTALVFLQLCVGIRTGDRSNILLTHLFDRMKHKFIVLLDF